MIAFEDPWDLNLGDQYNKVLGPVRRRSCLLNLRPITSISSSEGGIADADARSSKQYVRNDDDGVCGVGSIQCVAERRFGYSQSLSLACIAAQCILIRRTLARILIFFFTID